MEASKQSNYLATEPIGKLLLKFSTPCVLSMLVSALYNIVDQIFIGQGVGYLGNAATTVVYPFTVLALAVALMIGDGCAAFFSLSLGRGDHGGAHKSIGNGIILTLAVSILLTAAGFFFEDQLLRLFGVTDACYGYAKEYMDVILLGIPFFMFTSAMNGAIRADGSPKYAMIATITGAVINLILDPIAIFVFDLGVWGAALATIIGQVVTAIMSALYFRKTKLFRFEKSSFRLRGAVVGKIIPLGVSSFIIQIAIVVIMSVANNMIGRYGPETIYGADIPLSAVGIVMKVFAIVIAFSVGVAVGGQPILGFNFGAGHHDRVFKTFGAILLANLVIGGIAMALFQLYPKSIIRIFGNENELYNEYAVLCFRVFLGGIVLCCIQKAGSIFLQSIGNPVKSTILSLSRDVVFFVPGLLLLAPRFGVTGMLWAAPIADVLSFILTVILVWQEYRRIPRTKTTTETGLQQNLGWEAK